MESTSPKSSSTPVLDLLRDPKHMTTQKTQRSPVKWAVLVTLAVLTSPVWVLMLVVGLVCLAAYLCILVPPIATIRWAIIADETWWESAKAVAR